MARDVGDDDYYITTGGKIPVKWTSPEVPKLLIYAYNIEQSSFIYIGNILQEIFSTK